MEKLNRILIVEDDVTLREILESALKEEGFEVQSCANGKEAVEILNNDDVPRRPCLILTDLLMPVMNGAELIESLRHNDRLMTIPLLIITAMADKAIGNMQLPGGLRFIKKPFNLDSFIDAVKEFCDWIPQHA